MAVKANQAVAFDTMLTRPCLAARKSHRGDAYSLMPGDRTSVGPNFERNELFTKLRYAVTERAVLGFSATAYHNHQTGLNNSTLGLTPGTSNDSTQSYAVTGDFILTKSTTLQARAYTSRYDENSRTNYDDSNAAAFGFANLNERYHRLDARVSQQIGNWQLLQGGTAACRIILAMTTISFRK